ncbi:MAG: uracil-DNA glycosylase [Bryobacteraceae bacterium]
MKRCTALSIPVLREQIIACERCSRLRKHCKEVAEVKRRAYLDWDYWGKPVPPLGEATAKVLIIGLAPGAHGANRTGRMFTGDSSADFLFRALCDTGFASQPSSVSREDGLKLIDSYITCAVRCAPPDNKPLPAEATRCRPFLERELELLRDVRVVVALGRFGFDAYLSILRDKGVIERRSAFAFGHGSEHRLGEGQPLLIGSYHPSQQNTSTGKLTRPMLRSVFERARAILSEA